MNKSKSGLENRAEIERKRSILASYCAQRWPNLVPSPIVDESRHEELSEVARNLVLVVDARWWFETEIPRLVEAQNYREAEDAIVELCGAMRGAGLMTKYEIKQLFVAQIKKAA